MKKLILCICTLLLGSCNSKKSETYTGYVEGEFRLLSSLESGILADIKVAKGAFVKKDDVLAILEVTGMQISMEAAEAAFKLSKTQLERAKVLATEGVLPKAELEKHVAQFEKAESDYESANWHLKKYTIKAPEDGYIQNVLRQTGESATPQNPVIYFLPIKDIKVRFFLPQKDLVRIKLGDKVNVWIDGQAAPVSANISFISTQLEFTPPVIYSNRSRENLVFLIEAKPDMNNKGLLLKPGQPIDIGLVKCRMNL
jgi:HlyD family secretion protein